MKLREYISGKAVPLCFLGMGALCAGAFLAVAGMKPEAVGILALLFGALVALWLAAGYLSVRDRLAKLERTVSGLADKYLLGEVLPTPRGMPELQYYRIMKILSRSAVEAVETARREKEEYCDYVERWIHEIKTPLTACSLIVDNGGDGRKLKRELKRADNLTESILYFARMRTPQTDLQIKEIHVAAVMREAVRSQTAMLTAADISVETEGDFAVHTDGNSLRFILVQLLLNCAKYCPGCHIELKAGEGRITVEDDGPGIPSHELRRVTERGFTGTNGRRLGGGTGMGLYIADGLCRLLDITMGVSSERDRYTRFTLSFDILTKP